MYTGLGNGVVAAPLPAVAHGGARGGRGSLVAVSARPMVDPSVTASSLLPSPGEGGSVLPSAASLSSWWSARSTIEKAGIIGGGLALLGTIGYLLMPPSRGAAAAPRFGALGPPR